MSNEKQPNIVEVFQFAMQEKDARIERLEAKIKSLENITKDANGKAIQ
jgi:hypothetical protein